MKKSNNNLSFKKIKKIYHEEVKQEPVVEEVIEQPEVLPDLSPIVEEKQPLPEPKVEVVEGTENLVNEFLLAIGAQGLVEVVSAPPQPKVKAIASAFVDPSKLDDFLKNIQEEVPPPAPTIVEQTPTLVTPVTKEVVDLTKPVTSSKKSKVDPNLKAINDRLGLFERRLGELAMRPMGQDPGGGETKLRFLDDVDRSTIGDGKYLNYNDTTKKFQFSTLSGGVTQLQSDWTQTDNTALDYIKHKPSLFSGSYNDLTDKPTIPAAQIQSDWNQTTNTALDYIKNKPTIPDITDIEDALAATGEPMGHTDKSQSVISFDDASRTFSISPVSGSFEIWTKGVKRTITDTRQVTIPDTTGLYYIYFDTLGVLRYKTTFYDWPNDCMTAYVYWNELTNDAPYVADERHGITLDWQTHEYLHRTRGAAIANGFGATNYIVGGDGSLNTHMQLDIASGTFFDEDLEVAIVSTNTPTANTWEQDLSGPAKIPMFYINSGGGWVMDEPTNFPVKQGTLPKYNLYTGGVWTTPDIDNNKFGTTFIIATNNINYPIIGIMGQDSHANQGDAEAFDFSDLNLAGFPVVEMRPLYKLVYDCKNSYNNSVNARLVSIWDQRNFESVGASIASYTDHGALGGLVDDDHPQYLLRTDAPTALSEFTNDITSFSWTNSSPTPSGNFKTIIDADDGIASITFIDGLPGMGSSTTWSFDKDKVTFPDSTEQTTAWTGTYSYDDLTDKPTIPSIPTNVSSFTNDSGYLTSVSWTQVTGKPANIVTLNDVDVISNGMLVNDSITIGSTAVALGSSITTLTGLTGVTSNHTTAFIAGANAVSNVSLQMPSESALRNLTNGSTNMYFDVSIGGTTQGQFQFRSSSSYTNVLTMSSTGVTFNTDATVTARTPSIARTAFNSAIDSEITVDSMRFRISNQGGIFPQVIGNGSSRNLAWTGVGAISGSAVTQVGSTGTIVASNAWTSLYTAQSMNSAGDTVTVTLQDKAASRIYRITFMRSDNGSTTGYNIIGERLL